MRGFIYLATPYSHPVKLMRRWRAEAAAILTGKLMALGQPVFSPIVHGHAVCEEYDPKWDHQAWVDFGLAMLRLSSSLVVAKLPQWETSRGVEIELRTAAERGLPLMELVSEPMLPAELWRKLLRTDWVEEERDGTDH